MHPIIRFGARLAGVALLGVAVTACSSDSGNADVETAFLNEMIPHHQSAVAMAEIAIARAEHPELRELAQTIKREQEREIAQMQRILGSKAATPVAWTWA